MKYRLQTWNLAAGRALDVDGERIMGLWEPDVSVVQELNGHRTRRPRRLRALVKPARVRLSRNHEAAIVVAKGVRLRAVRRHRLTGRGWERGKGRAGLHAPRETLSVRIGPRGDAGIRVLNVHIPPAPDTWPLRRQARAQALRRVERIATRWNRQVERGRIGGWVLLGDWNHTANHPAVLALAKRLGGTVVGAGVDYAIVSEHVAVGSWTRDRRGGHGSDHDPRLYSIRLRGA